MRGKFKLFLRSFSNNFMRVYKDFRSKDHIIIIMRNSLLPESIMYRHVFSVFYVGQL